MEPGRPARVAVVLVAHGSRAAAANEAHLVAAATVERHLRAGAGDPPTVIAAFLELAEPSIGDAIDEVVAGGASRVVVIPHFLYPGRHVTEHVPEIVAAAQARHRATSIVLTGTSGESPGMVELLAQLAAGALDD